MKKLRKDTISLIVPCYNEEECLLDFYSEVYKVINRLKKVNFELIFIDDGSVDQTLNIIKRLAKKDKNIKYLSFSRNFGKEAGMYAGLEASSGDYAAALDVDLQDPPEFIIKMYKLIKEEDYDIVRLRSIKHKDYNIVRNTLTKLWYKIISKMASVKQEPGIREFCLMKKEVVEAILAMKEYNRYSKGIFSFVGFKTKTLEYEKPARRKGESKYSLKYLISYSIDGITSFSSKPLKLSVYLGLLLCLIAFIAIMIIIIKTLVYGDPVAGWPSLACIIIFVGGIQLFFLGVIGTYISKIYLEVKGRPLYIIKERNDK